MTKVKKKKKVKSIKELTKHYDEFLKRHGHNDATREDFDKMVKKITKKPSSK